MRDQKIAANSFKKKKNPTKKPKQQTQTGHEMLKINPRDKKKSQILRVRSCLLMWVLQTFREECVCLKWMIVLWCLIVVRTRCLFYWFIKYSPGVDFDSIIGCLQWGNWVSASSALLSAWEMRKRNRKCLKWKWEMKSKMCSSLKIPVRVLHGDLQGWLCWLLELCFAVNLVFLEELVSSGW